MSIFDGKAILITGGAGSFGQAFTEYLLTQCKPKKVVIFSRDERKQHQMSQRWPDGPYCTRFQLGDIRNADRLRLAFRGIDYILHAAALKHITACENDPFEAVRTNIIGAENIIRTVLESDVQRVVALSTDKAVQPINLYGATKLSSERLFQQAHVYSSEKKFTCARYGNIVGSSGSVIPLWRSQIAEGKPITVTDWGMTRFMLTLHQAIALVEKAFEFGNGGDILVPKIPAVTLYDLAAVVAPGQPHLVTGVRPGEKLHEQLLAEHEPVFDCGDHYRIAPGGSPGFRFDSNMARMLTVSEVKELIA